MIKRINVLSIVGIVSLIFLNLACGQSADHTADNVSSVIASFTGSEVINNENTIYLQNLPVVPDGKDFYVVLKVDGKTLLPGVDYAFPETIRDPITGYYSVTPEATLAYINDRTDPSDGYLTGTIKILNPSLISATSEISVIYAYYESVIGDYSGSGNGTIGPYYLKNIANIVPGTETVRVFEQVSPTIDTYYRNSGFDSDAGNNGYSINYDKGSPYIIFNEPLKSTEDFMVEFLFVR